MIQLLKSEQVILKGTKEEVFKVFNKLTTTIYLSYIESREAISGGYIRKNESVLATYNGRYGVGFSLFIVLKDSTRYCKKLYILYDIDYKKLQSIVESELNIKLKEGEYEWQ